MIDFDYIVKIEEKINTEYCRFSVDNDHEGSLINRKQTIGYYKDIVDVDLLTKKYDEYRTTRKDLVFIKNRLAELGYKVKENNDKSADNKNSISCPRFIDDAQITQSVWSRYCRGMQKRTGQDTLLKLVIGMRLDEANAKIFMGLAGSGFMLSDERDMIVLAIASYDYFGKKDPADITSMVYEIIEYYSEQQVKLKKPCLINLYDY